MKRNSSRGKRWSRRQFLRAAGCTLVTAPLWSSCTGLKPGAPGPGGDSRLNHACIGVGGAGALDLEAFAQDQRVRVVALCDVDLDHLTRAAQQARNARLYSDYREMLRAEGPHLDSVSMAVPAHMHFAIAAAAFRSGKHLCCHGLIGHDVAELRALRRLESHSDLVALAEPRAAASSHNATLAQWLGEGRLGFITRVYLMTNNPVADNFRVQGPRPTAEEPPPENLNWDLWLGTAPQRPFSPGQYHPGKWRSWQDFGTGAAMDDLEDLFYPIWRGLALGFPLNVLSAPEADWADGSRTDTWPLSGHVTWTFPGNEHTAGNELAVDWYDGQTRPPERVHALTGLSGEEFPPGTALVLGTEGTLTLPLSGMPTLKTRKGIVKSAESRSANSYQRFIEACFDGQRWRAPFEESTYLSETLLLANVARRFPGTVLNWNGQQGTFPGRPEANRFLARVYRDGWHIGPF